jgi:hypothetical protein
LVALVLAGCTSAKPAPEVPAPEVPPPAKTSSDPAAELMQRVVRTYAALTSYQDEGVVLSYWVDKPGPDELHFNTYFRKPADFRFEWVSHHPYPPLRHVTHKTVVWSNGQGTFSYWDAQPGIETHHDLGEGIAAATGVSGGAITSIPGLIFGEDTVLWSLESLRDLSLLEEEEFEGTLCLRLRGTHRGHATDLWIGKDDLLIRRTVNTHPPDYIDGKLPKSEEIRRNVQFDQRLGDETFEFTPPP